MSVLPKSVEKVIDEFGRLPGVGPKSASRMAYHYLRSSNHDGVKLAEALVEMDSNVQNCKHCFNITDKEVCDICSSPLRKRSKLCVVEEPLDVVAFEDSGIYDGLYFFSSDRQARTLDMPASSLQSFITRAMINNDLFPYLRDFQIPHDSIPAGVKQITVWMCFYVIIIVESISYGVCHMLLIICAGLPKLFFQNR